MQLALVTLGIQGRRTQLRVDVHDTWTSLPVLADAAEPDRATGGVRARGYRR